MDETQRVLVDADALVALAKVDDSNHDRATAIAQTITNAVLYITPFTIPEAATVISHRLSQQSAWEFLRSARKRKYLTISLTDDIAHDADSWFIKQHAKGTSWPDCLNMAVIEKHHLYGVFSFDQIYKKNGFKMIEIKE